MLTATPEADLEPPRRFDRAVSAESVAVFRIVFGLLITWSSFRFLWKGWVDTLYLEPDNHLTYTGFSWVEPLPAGWMHLFVAGLGVLGLCIAAGFRFRLVTAAFIVGFTYTELIEATLYLNHYWFLTVTALLLVVLPVHHHRSLDARAGRVISSPTVPLLVVWALRAQLAVVYVFAGIAKLNADWLLDAQPMQLWFADRSNTPLVGALLAQPATAYVASWSAALFDLTIVGWLLWRPARRGAYLTLVMFHLATGVLFQIGLFPFVMIVSTLIFFEPDWPKRLGFRAPVRTVTTCQTPALSSPKLAGLAFFAVIQIALPLRHYGYPSNVRVSEEGYYLAWRVMLTDKAGHLTFDVTDPATGRTWETGPELVLADWQHGLAVNNPDLIHATALLIADHYASEGIVDVEVRATSWVSINGRPAQQLLDPTIDLAAKPRDLRAKTWILSDPNQQDR